MTKPAEFPGYRECDKIPGVDVAAYADIVLDPENPTGIALDSTWGYNRLDLESVVKAGETVTHLELAPTNNPTVLRYFKEDGGIDCIPGDELSRIISMQLLKDVDQTQPIQNGAAYVYNETTGKFEPFEIVSALGDINTVINRLSTRITNLENRLSDIEAIIPFWPSDKTMKLARGTINLYSDYTNTNDKTDGLFTHDKSVDKTNDELFS